MTGDGGESALSRWSRRKTGANQADAEQAREQTVLPMVPEPGSRLPETVEAEPEPVLTDADMPDIETMNEDSDFSPFMSAGVSDELRNLALRKLFMAPAFNIRDGLDEYDEDYTSFEKLGDIVTADMKHRIEIEAQKLREKLTEQGESTAGDEAGRLETIDDSEDSGEAETEPGGQSPEMLSETVSDHRDGQKAQDE